MVTREREGKVQPVQVAVGVCEMRMIWRLYRGKIISSQLDRLGEMEL